jgi:hypothetical protein
LQLTVTEHVGGGGGTGGIGIGTVQLTVVVHETAAKAGVIVAEASSALLVTMATRVFIQVFSMSDASSGLAHGEQGDLVT